MIGCRSSGEEAAPVLGPGGLACGVLDRRHADRATASKLIGQRVGLMTREAKFCGRNHAGVIVSKVNARHDRRDRHRDEAERASPGADVERSGAHQWNICAAPGW